MHWKYDEVVDVFDNYCMNSCTIDRQPDMIKRRAVQMGVDDNHPISPKRQAEIKDAVNHFGIGASFLFGGISPKAVMHVCE